MHHHPRVAEAHTVNVATFLLLLEDGALLDADADFELICGDMHAGLSHFLFLALDEHLELHIGLDPQLLVVVLSLGAIALHFIHACAALFPLLLQFFDLIAAIRALLRIRVLQMLGLNVLLVIVGATRVGILGRINTK